MGKNGRTFAELKKQISNEQLENMAIKISERYTNSLPEYSQENLGDDFNLTTKAVRELMDYAIVNSLVSLKTAKQIAKKSMRNQQRKHPEAGGTSLRKQKKLLMQRNFIIAYSYDEDKVRKIAKSCIKDSSEDFAETREAFGIESKVVIYRVLERGIQNGILSTKDSSELIEIITKNYPTQRANDYWQDVWIQRQAFQETGEIVTLEEAIEYEMKRRSDG